jgi:hypothetical protein
MIRAALLAVAFLVPALLVADDPPVVAKSKIVAAVVPIPRPKPLEWTEVKCDAGVPVVLQVEGAKSVQWLLVDDTGASLTTLPDSQSAVFVGKSRHRVIAIADGKLNLTVMVAGDAPPPGPTPPPKPVDELVRQLQAAYDADPAKAGSGQGVPNADGKIVSDGKAYDIKQLTALYLTAVDYAKSTDDITTSGQLSAKIINASKALLPDDPTTGRRMAAIRKLVSVDLVAVLPTDEDAPLTEAVRSAASAAFSKYAKALAGVTP